MVTLRENADDDCDVSIPNKMSGIDEESSYISLGTASIENASRIDSSLDRLPDSTTVRPASSSVEQSSSMNLVDWSSKSDTQDGGGAFGADEDFQYFDADLLMSDFVMSEYFDINTPRGDDRMGDDSDCELLPSSKFLHTFRKIPASRVLLTHSSKSVKLHSRFNLQIVECSTTCTPQSGLQFRHGPERYRHADKH